jgi:hypothetical protein
MTGTKKSYKEYIEEQILSGKPSQEIYNEAVTIYDVKIHDVAEVIRKTPSLEKRLEYKVLNNILIFLLISNAILGPVNGKAHDTYVSVAPSLFTVFLLYGIYNFKYPAHIFASILLTVLTTILVVMMFLSFDLWVVIQLVLNSVTMVIAWYINSKISSDYTLNREMLKNDPDARIDVITFEDNLT